MRAKHVKAINHTNSPANSNCRTWVQVHRWAKCGWRHKFHSTVGSRCCDNKLRPRWRSTGSQSNESVSSEWSVVLSRCLEDNRRQLCRMWANRPESWCAEMGKTKGRWNLMTIYEQSRAMTRCKQCKFPAPKTDTSFVQHQRKSL